jgi:hypothetical protein
MTAQKSNSLLPKETKKYNKASYTFSYVDAFFAYPYKKWVQNTKGITKPYVPKEERTSTPFSLTYLEWRVIIDEYIKVLEEHLLEGTTIKIPHFGELAMVKRKCFVNPIDWNKTKRIYGAQKGKDAKDIKLIRHKNLSTDSHRWLIEWAKLGDAKLKHSNLWGIRPLARLKDKANDVFKSDVYRYRDANRTLIKSKMK